MTQTSQPALRHTTMGDAAVDGLWGGALAGALMLALLAAAGLAAGDSPASIMARFDPAETPSPVTGALLHLAVSGVYGLLFGLARRMAGRWEIGRRLPGWLLGVVFGLLLFGVAEGVILPGTSSALREFPPALFGVAHVVYGLVLGLLWRIS